MLSGTDAADRASSVETVFHVTILSNFARGYDKYRRRYDKAAIPESVYPGRFYLLRRDELSIGLAKAQALLRKTSLPGDRLLALESRVEPRELRPNLETGRGRFVERGWIDVAAAHLVDEQGSLREVQVEEAVAQSFRVVAGDRPGYAELAPRSVSILPVARACDAHCPFCFSRASASADVVGGRIDWERTRRVLRAAADRGARRAVITGGGEPSLLRWTDLLRLVAECRAALPKVVLISNGARWGRTDDSGRRAALRDLASAGLTVLSLSRHHHDESRNAALMGLETRSQRLAATWAEGRDGWPGLELRWICVLQKGAVEDRASLEEYLEWATREGVEQVCFKELYVSTSVESVYHDRSANAWSARNQVPLASVLELAENSGWRLREILPWGSPVFEGVWRGRPVRVAAYTEPSLLWELEHRVCRSWNLMADGRCLASLEDRNSLVLPRGLRELSQVS